MRLDERRFVVSGIPCPLIRLMSTYCNGGEAKCTGCLGNGYAISDYDWENHAVEVELEQHPEGGSIWVELPPEDER